MEVDMFFRDIDKRIKILFLVLSLLLVVVIIRVFYIQVFDYTKLSDLANDLWSRDLEIEADRGLIQFFRIKNINISITLTIILN